MAEKEAKTGSSYCFMECSLCFENDDLKRLPCNHNHIYCVTCLTKDSDTTKIIKCPQCRIVFDEGIDQLPSAGDPLDKLLCCDVCMRKNRKRKLAQIYCVICEKRFCTPHEKSHNDALDDHMRIRMDEYKRDHRKMETRYCKRHANQVSTMVCEKCYGIFCVECVHRIGLCTDGTGHQLMPLKMLITKLTEMVNKNKVWIFDKEEHLLGMSKQLATIISDWDTETQQMIEKLHQARDEQVAELAKRYLELEEKLVAMRTKAKTEVTCFLDDEIGVKLDKLSRQVARIEARIHTHHEVDVAGGYKETEDLIKELIKMKIPTYKPTSNHVQLADKDLGEVELSIGITQYEANLIVQRTPLTVSPPTSMSLTKTVTLPAASHSVTQHGDATYAGVQNGQLLKIKTNAQSVLVNISVI